MALEAGDVSLAGVVLEARGVWPVERSPYASALANGGLVGENLEKAPRGMCDETILTAEEQEEEWRRTTEEPVEPDALVREVFRDNLIMHEDAVFGLNA